MFTLVSSIDKLKFLRLQLLGCSRYANTRGDKHWFAKPCRPFHEIVYAKQKGFPYWPAKVVNNKENSDGQVGSSLLGK